MRCEWFGMTCVQSATHVAEIVEEHYGRPDLRVLVHVCPKHARAWPRLMDGRATRIKATE